MCQCLRITITDTKLAVARPYAREPQKVPAITTAATTAAATVWWQEGHHTHSHRVQGW